MLFFFCRLLTTVLQPNFPHTASTPSGQPWLCFQPRYGQACPGLVRGLWLRSNSQDPDCGREEATSVSLLLHHQGWYHGSWHGMLTLLENCRIVAVHKICKLKGLDEFRESNDLHSSGQMTKVGWALYTSAGSRCSPCTTSSSSADIEISCPIVFRCCSKFANLDYSVLNFDRPFETDYNLSFSPKSRSIQAKDMEASRFTQDRSITICLQKCTCFKALA